MQLYLPLSSPSLSAIYLPPSRPPSLYFVFGISPAAFIASAADIMLASCARFLLLLRSFPFGAVLLPSPPYKQIVLHASLCRQTRVNKRCPVEPVLQSTSPFTPPPKKTKQKKRREKKQLSRNNVGFHRDMSLYKFSRGVKPRHCCAQDLRRTLVQALYTVRPK